MQAPELPSCLSQAPRLLHQHSEVLPGSTMWSIQAFNEDGIAKFHMEMPGTETSDHKSSFGVGYVRPSPVFCTHIDGGYRRSLISLITQNTTTTISISSQRAIATLSSPFGCGILFICPHSPSTTKEQYQAGKNDYPKQHRFDPPIHFNSLCRRILKPWPVDTVF
jgi:hypothetical protein